MSEKQKQIMETLEKFVPKLDELECEKLLSFSEGMAFMKQKQEDNEEKQGVVR